MTVLCAAGEDRVIPSFQTAQPGDNVKFNCKSDKKVTWKNGDGPLPSNAKTKKAPEKYDNVMEISNVNYNNSGEYICQGQDDYGHPFRAKGELHIPGKLFIDYNNVFNV